MNRDLDGWDYEKSGENDGDLNVEDVGLTDTCPEHGEQDVRRLSQCGPDHDPTETAVLACGHEVASFGPGDPNSIVRTHRAR